MTNDYLATPSVKEFVLVLVSAITESERLLINNYSRVSNVSDDLKFVGTFAKQKRNKLLLMMKETTHIYSVELPNQ